MNFEFQRHRVHDYRFLIKRWRSLARKARLSASVYCTVEEFELLCVTSPALKDSPGIYLSAGLHGGALSVGRAPSAGPARIARDDFPLPESMGARAQSKDRLGKPGFKSVLPSGNLAAHQCTKRAFTRSQIPARDLSS